MRKVIIIICVLSVIGVAFAGFASVLFSGKTFKKADTRTDTSATISLRYGEYVELATAVAGVSATGSDLKIYTYVDGLVAGSWRQIYTDSVTGQYRIQQLRGYGVNNIKGVEQIRVRNKMSVFTDSVSATSYTQHVIVR